MHDSRIGFGLLGAGVIAPTHANALRASSLVEFVAVADLNADLCGQLAREYGCAAYPDLDALLDDPAVQVVNISIPNHLHYGAVMQCLRAGRHVLVEKPPAMSLREIDEMAALSRESGCKVGVILQGRLRKTIRALRAAIAEGRFGQIYHADTYLKWYRSAEYYTTAAWRRMRQAGAGVTIQQAIHCIDMLQFCVGPAQRVTARMRNLAHPEVDVEDTLVALTDFAGGAQGVVQASTALWPGDDFRLEIHGEHGTAVIIGERVATWVFREERPEDDEMRRYDPSGGHRAITHAVADYSGHQKLIEDMAAAIREDREPVIDLASVRPTMEWILAMYRSAQCGVAVDLPLTSEEGIW